MVKRVGQKEKKARGAPWGVLWPGERGATKGDVDSDALHAAVGFALSRWEELEDELARLFCELIGARWGQPAVRAFGTVPNSRNRIDMLDEAATAFFHFAIFRKKIAGPDK